MIRELILFLGTLMFLGYVFLGSTPQERMDRSCSWVGGVGALVEAGGELATSPGSDTVRTIREYTDKTEYGCQYIIWRAFYAHPDQIDAHSDETTGSDSGEYSGAGEAMDGGSL